MFQSVGVTDSREVILCVVIFLIAFSNHQTKSPTECNSGTTQKLPILGYYYNLAQNYKS